MPYPACIVALALVISILVECLSPAWQGLPQKWSYSGTSLAGHASEVVEQLAPAQQGLPQKWSCSGTSLVMASLPWAGPRQGPRTAARRTTVVLQPD